LKTSIDYIVYQKLQALRNRILGGQRVKTPTVLQMEAVECGAAALGKILGYFGRIVPLEELRVVCGVSRDGVKAVNVLKAARAYGLEATGYRKEISALKESDFPLIVFWNFNHFLVVEGFRRGKFYLNDPARGPYSVSEAEFDDGFTGITLEFSPGSKFEKGGQKRRIVPALTARLRGSWGSLVYIVLATLGLALLGLLTPAFIRVFIDQFLVAGVTSWLPALFLGMLLTGFALGAFTWLQQHYLLRLETKLSISMSGRFFWHVLRLPVDFFNQRYASEITTRVGINDRVSILLSGQVATNLLNVVLVILFLGVMFRYDPILAALSTAIALVNFLVLRATARRRVDINQRVLQEEGKLLATSFNGLQMIETLKATGGESDFFARWGGYHATAVTSRQELGSTTKGLEALPTVLTATNLALLLMVGGMRIMNGQLTFGELFAVNALLSFVTVPINQIVQLGSRLQETEGDLARLDDVLRYPEDPQTLAPTFDEGTNAGKLSGRLELQDLTFGYSPLSDPLIEEFDLKLEPGARVALVGGSGAGKSTIAKIVSGIYQSWSGELLFDHNERKAIPRAQMTASLAIVNQEIYLFEGSVRDNITMWDASIPHADVIRAAKDALIHDDIAARPGGYDSQVAENGANFSGGQRQRLEIARALVNNPTLLLLDEATSALDPITEKKIDDNLRRRGCTTLIVAHRLSTIRDCDEIIVLEEGKVVQRGTHSEMMRSGGPYVELIHSGTGAKEKSLFDLI
jgi:NHLM bacteriocin system ABC transporter peptidase/ATP-binding protein